MRRNIILLLLPLLFLAACSAPMPTENTEEASSSLFAMNTYMTFTAYGENAQTALEESAELIEEVESLWSVTDAGSEV